MLSEDSSRGVQRLQERLRQGEPKHAIERGRHAGSPAHHVSPLAADEYERCEGRRSERPEEAERGESVLLGQVTLEEPPCRRAGATQVCQPVAQEAAGVPHPAADAVLDPRAAWVHRIIAVLGLHGHGGLVRRRHRHHTTGLSPHRLYLANSKIRAVRRLAILLVVVAVGALVAAGGVTVVRRQRAEHARTNTILADARAEARAGHKEVAAGLFRDYLGKNPGDTSARRQYADIVLEDLVAGKLKGKEAGGAFELLEWVVRENPDDHWIRFQLATCQMRVGEVAAALGHVNALKEACGTDGVLESSGALAEQEKRRVTRRDIEALAIDGFMKTGQFSDAVDSLSRLVEFDPDTRRFEAEDPAATNVPTDVTDTSSLFEQLAHLLENELNDEDAAGRVIARNTVVNANDPAAWISLAKWKWFHDKDLQAAQEAVAKATAVAPNDSQVLEANFYTMWMQDRLDEAAALAERGLSLYPTHLWPYYATATLRTRMHDVPGTLSVLQNGVERLAAAPAILQMLVDLPDEPEWNKAIENALASLAPLPANEERFRKVLEGRALMARGRWLEAITALQTARALAQGQNRLQVAANLALAKCHERLGDCDLQLAAAQRALVENSSSTDARAAVAEALLACGRLDAALHEFRRVAKALPAADLADRPDIWAPLLRLEYSAIARGRPERRALKDVDALTSTLRAEVSAEVMPLLDAEQLVGDGKINEAIAALDTARVSAPDDARLATAAVSLLGRLRRPEQLADLVRSLPNGIRDDAGVMVAFAEASRTLPPSASGALADELLSRHPDDLLAAMTALHARLRLGRRDDVAAVAKTIATIAGADSTHAGYAEAAAWLLGAKQEANELSTSGKQELPAIRERLAGIEVQRASWTELQHLLAEIDALAGQTKEAIARFQQALSTRPTDTEIVTQLATLLMEEGRYTDAEKTLDGLDATDLQRLGRLTAELRLRAGKVDEAVSIALRAAESAAGDTDDLLWFADVLAAHGNATAAATALERGLSQSPARIDLWLALADLHVAAGDSAAALTALEQASEKAPEDGRPIFRAEIDRRAGRVDAAVATFRTLAEGPSADHVVLRRAAECFLDAGLATDAQAALERLHAIRPATKSVQEATLWARQKLTAVRLRDGPFTLAQKALQQLKDNSAGRGTFTPEDADFASRLLAGRPEPKSWRTALDMLEGLGRQQALTVSQSVLAARLRSRVGNWRQAREDLRTLALQPDMPDEVFAAFVALLLERDDPKTAATYIGKLLAQAPSAPETITLQAKLALAQGDSPKAVAAAKRLMPEGDVTAENVASVLATARTMEDLGFMPAADNLLVRAAAAADAGILDRVGFLMRRNRIDEAAELLESSRDALANRPRFTLLEAALCEKRDRAQDAEIIYGRLLDATDVQFAERVQATARLVRCLLDRDAVQDAYALADRAVSELGPHPDLLDARGVASIGTGYTAGAVRDLTEAAMAPTPERLLHLAQAQSATEAYADARSTLQRAAKAGLEPAALRPSDRQRLDLLAKTLGIKLR